MPSQADGYRDGIPVLPGCEADSQDNKQGMDKQIRKTTKKVWINHDLLEASVGLVL